MTTNMQRNLLKGEEWRFSDNYYPNSDISSDAEYSKESFSNTYSDSDSE